MPLSNAERQRRFRERKRLLRNPPRDLRTLDMFDLLAAASLSGCGLPFFDDPGPAQSGLAVPGSMPGPSEVVL